MSDECAQVVDGHWITFPGGELEGKRPSTLCPSCREQLRQAAASRIVDRRSGYCRFVDPFDESINRQSNIDNRKLRGSALCFQCYRAELDRQRALKAAGALETGSPQRFQFGLPFEPVNKPRLEKLKTERATARAALMLGAGRFADKRRRAQIAARHALDAIAAGLNARPLAATERDRVMNGAIHAAELQLPESWLQFVVSR